MCCLGGFGMLQYSIHNAGSSLEGDLARAKAAGLPTEIADLHKPIPAGQNAAPIYTKITAKLTLDKKLDRMVSDAGTLSDSATDKQIQAQELAWPKVQGVLAEFERASDLPYSEFDRDWNKGFAVLFPEYSIIKNGSRLLAAKADRQSKAGDWKGALTSVQRAVQNGRHAESDSVLIGLLVDVACEAIATRSLQRVVQENSRSAAALDASQKTLDNYGSLPNFKRAMEGEFVLGRVSLRELKSSHDLMPDSGDSPGSAVMDSLLNNGGIKRGLEAKFVNAYVDFLLGLPDDGNQWHEMSTKSEEFGRQVEADNSVWNYLNKIMLPVFSQAANTIGVAETRRKLTRMEIELYRKRNATGKFPWTLSGFGDLAKDPISGELFIYKSTDKGFLIYGVGVDGKDNGGNLRKTGDKDIVIDTRQ